ncbi:MAG: CmcJ/NvfI family oxidoreductase [Kiloniellales bacterium]|nr:CmcJ/NvfI family oxidoreductase [Kiloniellales bacterium]
MATLSALHSGLAEGAPAGIPANDGVDRDRVEAELTYLVDTGVRPVSYMPPLTGGEIRRTGHYAPYRVAIRSARPIAGALSLDREGFILTRHDTAVGDFRDAEAVRRRYYPEMARLVRSATGAARVEVFDHNVRLEGAPDRDAQGIRAPVRMVHNDYTAKSGPQRVRDLFGAAEAEALLKKRFAIINVWRPIAGPVETAPLAFADAGSIAPEDLVPLDLVYPERTGEIYNVTFNPAHRWYYLPRMTRDEAVLIKGYDSLEDGRARFAPHTAFDDPTTPIGAAPRHSIEVRTLAFFDA